MEVWGLVGGSLVPTVLSEFKMAKFAEEQMHPESVNISESWARRHVTYKIA